MRKIILLGILLAAFFRGVSQDVDSVTLSRLKLNFAVPDMPAFKSLGTDPSDLLRPSTVKALAVNLSSFNDSGKFIIPKAFALEISPSLLLNAHKKLENLSTYNKRRTLNSFRISVGTADNDALSAKGRSLAFGIRISPIDKGDLLTDSSFQKIIAQKLREVRKTNLPPAKIAFAKSLKLDPDKIDVDSLVNVKLEEFSKFFQDQDDIQKAFDKALTKEKEKYKKDHWNDSKMDIAAAIMTTSPDTVLKNLKFNQANLWAAYAVKAGNYGQFIIGINGRLFRNLSDTAKLTIKKNYGHISVPARFMLGTNRIKGFVEIQYSYASLNKETKLFGNLGSEINIIDGIWLHLFAGLDYSSVDKTTKVIGSFNFKLTLPENFKFF